MAMAEPNSGDGGNRTHGGFPQKRTKPGYVYFVQEGDDGPVKIGWANSPKAVERRHSSLRIGNPRELVLRAFHRAPRAYEHHLHWHFGEARIRGEWFEPVDDLRLLVRAAEAGSKADETLRAAYDDLTQRILERSRQPDGPFYRPPSDEGPATRRGGKR